MSEDKPRTYSLFPKTLADCVEPLTRPILKAKGLAGSRIITEWESIVGSKLSLHTMPEKLAFSKGKKVDGTLTISVQNGFATELQYMQPMILERLATYFGYHAISRIVISHTWVESPKAAKTIAKPTLSKAKTSIDFRGLAESVEDDELRAVLQSFAKTLSEPTS